MPKPASTYAARLSEIINLCIEVYKRDGFITSESIASVSGLSERMVRQYLKDLVDLEILVYVGDGRYYLNMDRCTVVSRALGLEPRTQLRLDDFVDPKFLKVLDSSDSLRRRMSRLLERLGWSRLFDRSFREGVFRARLDGGVGNIIGDRFIYPRGARRVVLDDVALGSSASDYEIENYGVSEFAVLTITYLSAASFIGFYKNDVLVREKCVERVIPDLSHFYGREPFIPEEPFYEMTTDFPELLSLGRKIASRLLSQISHYRLDIAMIEKYGDRFPIYFRAGSLFPHGYIVRAKKLIELQRSAYQYFNELINLAREKNVLLVGVSHRSHDNVFAKALSDYFNVNIATASDDQVLSVLMDDGDVTAIIARGPEKGRPTVQNWYEFYIKFSNEVFKVEFISWGNLEEEYGKIRDLLYSSASVAPKLGVPPGPGPMINAAILATRNVNELKRTIKGVLMAAFTDYINRLSRGEV